MKTFILLGKDVASGKFLVAPPDEWPVEVQTVADGAPLPAPYIEVTAEELAARISTGQEAATAWQVALATAIAAAPVVLTLEEVREARAKRYEAEASVYDLADAETKLASTDPSVQAEGAAQKTAVTTARLAIKAAIPKP